ncbi:uncharacterized protein LACBIDRAFT_300299 [Laccaria bicolor S238N-H82]|uniref:Predicted protein n=1 Tax=Laccaria bicolor (strain S238N-H82 / ATCC MYA-4686) TaxID=486041 RepID=B0DGF5_LACBS|nr:uncharacterized protein LACBIDRAFT_300299 [Laccaria bicolor S238N-H82]EDR06144.1 predicted protein [Laccaria bicolor S238N-H82]|eukprot:XP_001883005.1 predicted protein [Laccaria bicolor S238N-H82]
MCIRVISSTQTLIPKWKPPYFRNAPFSVILSKACGSAIVFKGSVQSGFLPRKRATVDRNRSRTNPDIEGTEPNHL